MILNITDGSRLEAPTVAWDRSSTHNSLYPQLYVLFIEHNYLMSIYTSIEIIGIEASENRSLLVKYVSCWIYSGLNCGPFSGHTIRRQTSEANENIAIVIAVEIFVYLVSTLKSTHCYIYCIQFYTVLYIFSVTL